MNIPTFGTSELPFTRPRTLARYLAAALLYQLELTRDDMETALEPFWASETGRLADAPIRAFSTQLVSLALKHLDTIDRLIEQYARRMALHRLPSVDLALLRLGCAEMLYLRDVPPVVTINEIVELAKTLSTDESPSFLNAVLDRLQAHREEVPDSERVVSQWLEPRPKGLS